MTKRYNYIVGDLQGCFTAFNALREHIAFDETQDCFWFAGDLVARGDDSLATLREVKRLHALGAAHVVLGNHDLNLLAVWRGFKQIRIKDGTLPIIQAPDVNELMHWLRQQPLMVRINADYVLSHAGVPHCWTIADALHYANEVHAYLRADISQCDQLLAHLYGTLPDVWQDDLQGFDRLRIIVNYLTRMRVVTAEAALNFAFTDGLDDPMPEGVKPWFMWPKKEPSATVMAFGHWAALRCQRVVPHILPIDGGCVWGEQLVAFRIEDNALFSTRTGCGLTPKE